MARPQIKNPRVFLINQQQLCFNVCISEPENCNGFLSVADFIDRILWIYSSTVDPTVIWFVERNHLHPDLLRGWVFLNVCLKYNRTKFQRVTDLEH